MRKQLKYYLCSIPNRAKITLAISYGRIRNRFRNILVLPRFVSTCKMCNPDNYKCSFSEEKWKRAVSRRPSAVGVYALFTIILYQHDDDDDDGPETKKQTSLRPFRISIKRNFTSIPRFDLQRSNRIHISALVVKSSISARRRLSRSKRVDLLTRENPIPLSTDRGKTKMYTKPLDFTCELSGWLSIVFGWLSGDGVLWLQQHLQYTSRKKQQCDSHGTSSLS